MKILIKNGTIPKRYIDLSVTVIALNKPKGVVCTTNAGVEENNIIDYINFRERVFPIGRLDKTTTGLILLTNDGDTANKILKTAYNNEKEYLVRVNRPISEEVLKIQLLELRGPGFFKINIFTHWIFKSVTFRE